MIGNKYKYALIDLSYILMRNMYAASKGKNIGEYNEGDIIRITIQTLRKIVRDFGISADKFIMLYDKWDKQLGGYYRTWLLKDFVKYKGTRVYMTEEEVERMIASGEYTEEDILKAKLEAYQNQVKYKAKWGMISDLGKIGIPCFGVEGWEFDDLAWLTACQIYGQDNGKPSVIITKDSDLTYSLTPQMQYFKIPTGGSDPKIITYEDMYATIPEELKAKGISLYMYKAFLDSLGYGHNDMSSTRKSGISPTEAILKILQGDYSDVENVEAFKTQMKSFDLGGFPRLQEAKDLISTKLGTVGRLGTLDDFHKFCDKYKVSGITDKYYSEFIAGFDQKLFSV